MLQTGPTWLLAAVFVLADVLPIPSCDCSSSDETLLRKVRGKATITKIEARPQATCDDAVLVHFDFVDNERAADSPHNATDEQLMARGRVFPRAFIERKGIFVGRAYASTKRLYPRGRIDYSFSNLDLSDYDGDCFEP